MCVCTELAERNHAPAAAGLLVCVQAGSEEEDAWTRQKAATLKVLADHAVGA